MTNINTAGPSIQSKKVKIVRLPVKDYKLALQNVIYISNLQLNILFAEHLKKNNFIKYFN
jgi:hypothetical protein